jgi:uncharacterized protein
MFTPLPEHADPWRLADAGKRFVGQLALDQLPRLGEELLEPQTEVEYELTFGRDGQNRAVVNGRAKATLFLQCQRCLGILEYPVDREISLALVDGLDEARGLPDGYEPLLLEEPRISLVDLIEDELLLALPQVPKHSADACTSGVERTETAPEQQQAVRDNPFAVLDKLKQKPD